MDKSNNSNTSFTQIGAGLVGSLLSIFLRKREYSVEIFEKRSDPRKGQGGEGLSINLALSSRGLLALKKIGVMSEALEIALPMSGRLIHSLDGKTSYQSYGKDEREVIYSISREELNKFLVDEAEKNKTTIHFDSEIVGYLPDTGKVEIRNQKDNSLSTIEVERLIATDGANSQIRQSLSNQNYLESRVDFLPHGYKELELPASQTGDFQLEHTALHIWPRGNFMLIALPNLDKTFTCTLFFPHEGKVSFASLDSDKRIEQFFIKYFPDIVKGFPDLVKQFNSNPTGNLGTLHCSSFHYEDKTLLLGDAAHAVVPFYGQGMNCGFEDCLLFDQLIHSKSNVDWKTIFSRFSQERMEDAKAIAQLSLDNFIEMRDSVGDPLFLNRKKIELQLYQNFPQDIISKYSMVSFHPEIKYKQAYDRGQALEQTIKTYLSNKKSSELSSSEIKTLRDMIVQEYKKLEEP